MMQKTSEELGREREDVLNSDTSKEGMTFAKPSTLNENQGFSTEPWRQGTS
jgi:hypothetical protein